MRPMRVIAILLLVVVLAAGLVSASLAQTSQPLVTITRLDSQTFPQVTAYVAVTGEDGLPVPNLTEADFALFEDGTEIVHDSLKVEGQVPQDLRLVLAVDTSVPDQALASLKQALTALLEQKQPQDKIALIAFADTVKVVHDFTSNGDELQAAVTALTRAGDYTVLNEAAAEAVKLAGGVSEGRPAVIVVTDSRDNRGTLTVDNFVKTAQKNRIPLVFIGFGGKVQPNDLRALAGPTRGQAILLANLDEMETTFVNVAELLRQGYRLTFQSDLEADNAEHELAINVRGEGQTQRSFVATPNPVTVTLPRLAPGQTIGGRVELLAQATASAPLAAMEYLLDEQLLATVTKPPFSLEWDSTTVKPGRHTLIAKATDETGNEGQAEVELNIVPPLVVTVTTSKPKITVGDQIPIQANIEALNPITKVEFLLDGIRIGQSNASHSSFPLDTSHYTVGLHELTVRVEDQLGQQAEGSFTVEFLAPPPPPPNRAEFIARLALILLVLLLAIIAILFIFFLLRLIVNWQKRRCQRRIQVEVANQGNIAGPYGLRASDPAGLLRFQFRLNGTPLPIWSPSPSPSEPEVMTYIEAPQPVEVAQAASSPAPVSTTNKPANLPGAANSLAGAQQAADRAMGAGSLVADILGAVGSLLPGSMGNSLRNTAGQIRSTQVSVGQTTRAPIQMVNTAKRLPGQVSKVAPGAIPAAKVTPALPPAQTASTGTGPVSVTTPASRPVLAAVNAPPQAKSKAKAAERPSGPTWMETPLVPPGQTLICELLIDPINHYRSRDYDFVVTSAALEQAESASVPEEGQVYVKGISWLARLWPAVLAAAAIAAIVLLAGYGMLWLAGAELAGWPLLGRFVAAVFLTLLPYPFTTFADI